MTFGKYKRLLLVVSLPLLLVGYILSEFVMPYPKSAYLVCQSLGTMENCRNVGAPGENLHDRTKQQSKAWFQIDGGPISDTHVFYIVEGDARTLGRVTVDEVVPYSTEVLTNPQAPAQMEKLKGREAMMRMGIEKEQRSVDLGSEIFLFCHTLTLDMDSRPYFNNPGPYTAQCVADGWGGYVSVKPSPEAEQHLKLLRDGVAEEVGKIERDFMIHRVVLTIAPLVLFLILSAVFWTTRRATAFVRAG